ncbi:MAG: glycosyltransferase, partial [Xanthobacteraceae bacterium]
MVPEQGIEIIHGETVALTGSPWLRIEPIAELVQHKWVRLHYSSSFYDEPVRPLIRFVTKKGYTIIQPMNGPVLGSAEWVGRIPDGTAAVSISPVARTGRFAFQLNEVSAVRRADLVRQGLRRNPDWLLWAARSRLVNSRREAWQALGFATGGTPVSDYAKWRLRLARPTDLDGLDAPRSDWRNGPVFRLLLRLRGSHDPHQVAATIRSLRGQVYPRWCLCAVSEAATSDALIAAFRKESGGDPRFSQRPLDDKLTEQSSAADFAALIDIGDQLPDYALATIAEVLSREPELEFVYSDEDHITTRGDFHHPVLKPDWSPVLQQHIGYVGRLALFRSRRLDQNGGLWSLVSDEKSAIENFIKNIPPSAVRHIRRVLYRRHTATADATTGLALRGKPRNAEPVQWPQVAVIIPTRDNVKHLAACLDGLRNKTDYPLIETIIVDNGSSEPAAVAFLQQTALEPHVTVLRRPGPFNFSALSNDGA